MGEREDAEREFERVFGKVQKKPEQETSAPASITLQLRSCREIQMSSVSAQTPTGSSSKILYQNGCP